MKGSAGNALMTDQSGLRFGDRIVVKAGNFYRIEIKLVICRRPLPDATPPSQNAGRRPAEHTQS
jgi:hypothetical protein